MTRHNLRRPMLLGPYLPSHLHHCTKTLLASGSSHIPTHTFSGHIGGLIPFRIFSNRCILLDGIRSTSSNEDPLLFLTSCRMDPLSSGPAQFFGHFVAVLHCIHLSVCICVSTFKWFYVQKKCLKGYTSTSY